MVYMFSMYYTSIITNLGGLIPDPILIVRIILLITLPTCETLYINSWEGVLESLIGIIRGNRDTDDNNMKWIYVSSSVYFLILNT